MERYRARKAALEEERAVMQSLNDNIASLCGKMGYTGNYEADVARARYAEKKLEDQQSQVGATASRPIVVEDEGDLEDDPAYGRLSELIALAEAGLQAKKEDDDTGRLSELIGLAEAGPQARLQAEEDEDDFFSQAAQAIDEAEATYYRQKVDLGNVGEARHMIEAEEDKLFSQATDEAEAAYYSRQVDQGHGGKPSKSNEVVVEDWYSDDELLTQYVTQF